MADERAACRDSDPDLFFPDGRPDSESVRRQVAVAKAVCAACLVLGLCRAFALDHPRGTAFGVWGGLSEEERAELTQRMAAPSRSGVAA